VKWTSPAYFTPHNVTVHFTSAVKRTGRNYTCRNITAAGSDDERNQGGRHVPNHAPTVPSSVLDQDIAGRQHYLHAIVELECHVAGEKDPEIRRVGSVKAIVSSTGYENTYWCLSSTGSEHVLSGAGPFVRDPFRVGEPPQTSVCSICAPFASWREPIARFP
jgi:hypothetical protein